MWLWLGSIGYLARQVCRPVYPLGWPRVHSCGTVPDTYVEPRSSDFEAIPSPEFIYEDLVLWLEVMCWCRIRCWPSILHIFHSHAIISNTSAQSPNFGGVFLFHCYQIHPESSSRIFSVDSYSSLFGCMCELPVHIPFFISAILSISFPRSAGGRILVNFLSLMLRCFSVEVSTILSSSLLSRECW